MDWVPSGEMFLHDISIGELKKLYRKEKEAKVKLRLLCATLRKREYSVSDISKHLEIPRMTVSDWLRRLYERGLSGLYDRKQTGRPNKLNKEQLTDLEKILGESPQNQNLPFVIWTTKLVRDLIQTKYGISYRSRQTRNILQDLGFSPQKPRPRHRKASVKSQEDFKKTSGRTLGHTSKMDMRSWFWTKASSR